ncbi:uncharacterized protein LOC107806684 [Nicotiana tabacum]|uniref:Uncharacterized protein LOC107806684 n=1 Tax=Nicotiana tabacum TaxID=4097 RepID=A0AC58UGC8_TOBAC
MDWHQRYGLIPPYPPHKRVDGEHEYMVWYRRVTCFLIGNLVHRNGGLYVPYVGRHEALVIGLHRFYQLVLEMLQHIGDGATVVHGLGRRVVDLAAYTLRAAREDTRLGYEAAYVPHEEYHHGPHVALARDRRGLRGRGSPRGRGGQ